MSLKNQNFETMRSVVNDSNGCPIVIQGVVVWNIGNTAAATFEVENYEHYIRIQCESAIRELAAKYPYESETESNLRGSPEEVSETFKNIVELRCKKAGIRVVETRLSHLAYSADIA